MRSDVRCCHACSERRQANSVAIVKRFMSLDRGTARPVGYRIIARRAVDSAVRRHTAAHSGGTSGHNQRDEGAFWEVVLAVFHHSSDAKARALHAAGALNMRATSVVDAAFVGHPFFDARDLVQVKYEMVRRVEADGQSVTQTAASFGFSRPAFYAAQAALAHGGLPALVRQRPGPRRRHKLRPEIVSALRQARADEPMLLSSELAERVRVQFGVRVHRRTIERVLGPRPKRSLALER
jgi:transposase